MPLSHVVGFDDAPFSREHRGDVLLVGAVFAGTRLEGILSGKVRRDGRNATPVISQLVNNSRFAPQLHAVLLQGITFAGFNVVDIEAVRRETGLPVLIISRRAPQLLNIKKTLLNHVPGGKRKWRIIERTGPMEAVSGMYVQRAGLSLLEAEGLIKRLAAHSRVPEPLRVAHLVAAGIVVGESRHSV